MIWEGCGECKYCWTCGPEDNEYLYCIPRERACDKGLFGNFRDKECGLVEGISVGSLRKLLEGLNDTIVVDVWFHKSLLLLGKDDFFGKGTLDELYNGKRYEDYTEEDKKNLKDMILQRNPKCRIADAKVDTEDLDGVCINSPSESDKESNEIGIAYVEGDPKDFAYSSKIDTSFFDANKVKDMKLNLPEVKLYNIVSIAHNDEAPCISDDKRFTQEEFDADPDLPGYLNPKYSMTDEEYQEYMDSIMTREEQRELSRRFIEAKKNNTDIDLKGLLEGKKENK